VDTDALIASYLSSEQMSQVRTFASTLLEWNAHMNLTGAATVEEVLSRHVADSLALIPPIEAALAASSSSSSSSSSSRTPRILDVGSGAGFPGVALAIARPRWEVTLLDTLQKRVAFLDAAAATCGATNVKTLWSRAEDAGKVGSEHREAYDVVTARAVAELRVLAELCVPLVRVGGSWVAAKNSRTSTAEETKAAAAAVKLLGGAPLVAEEVQSEGPDGELRTAVVSAKARETPGKYPRRAGLANKRPL
jgi:16S rRNA (guanine527-N7)-methyltransferase